MNCVTDTTPKRLPAKLAAGFAVAALLVLTAGAVHADERWHREHGWEERHEHHWTGGYYRAPPVVYGGGYYYAPPPPPVVYGPGIGIALPGINLNIR